MENYRILIAQLRHAVERANGKTTLTQTDINTLETMYRQLREYSQVFENQ